MQADSFGLWFNRSYLAVDYFFVLSGFVVALAYEDKLAAGLGVLRFTRIRLVRLYPLLFVAGALGALAGWVGADPAPAVLRTVGRQLLLVPTLEGSLYIFPYNLPSWSLLFEIVVNVLYAALLPVLSNRVVYALVFLNVALLASYGVVKGDIDFGAGAQGLPLALPRASVTFLIGVLIYRRYQSGELPRLHAPAWLLFGALAALFAAPVHGPLGGVYDLLCVLLVFPALLVAGIQQHATSRWMTALGELSYPVYILHFPLLLIVVPYLPEGLGWAPRALLAAAAVVGASWGLQKAWDDPIRRWARR